MRFAFGRFVAKQKQKNTNDVSNMKILFKLHSLKCSNISIKVYMYIHCIVQQFNNHFSLIHFDQIIERPGAKKRMVIRIQMTQNSI